MKRIVFGILLLISTPSTLLGLVVHFKDNAVVSGPVLTLSDVADLTPFSKAEILSELELFPGPPPGVKECYDSGTFKRYVLNAVVNKDSVRWEGAEVVCVHGKGGAAIGRNEIQSLIDTRLQEALRHLPADKIFFEARHVPDMPSLPAGKVEYDVSFSDRDILKSRQVNVTIKVDGRVRETFVITGQVQAFLPVVVAVEHLSRGTVLEQSHLAAKVMNIAGLKDPCMDLDGVIGKKLKKSVPMNQAISELDLDMPLLIERRQLITMVLQKGALRISTMGLASANGRMGDMIMVKNVKSNREIPCRVVGPGLAMVEF